MIVDDEPANLAFLEDALGKQGYPLSIFPSGEMALNAAVKTPPDLVLLDIRMRGMNGYQVCEAFKSNDLLKEIPIIFLSALTDESDIINGFECGAVDYVTKPFRAREVVARVETQLSLAHSRRELERSYQELRDQEQLRKEMVDMIVHDMRSPLHSVMGYLDLLDPDSECWSDDQRSYIDNSLVAMRLLNNMALDLLDVSRMSETSLPVHLDDCKLNPIIEDVLKFSLIGSQSSRTVWDPPCDDVTLRCDRKLLMRILSNLLSNAFKYSPPGSPVRLSAFRRDGMLHISVEDRGLGVDEQIKDAIFEKFATFKAKNYSSMVSIGIGLTFCRMAAEAQGGEILLESESGKGSTFTLVLPTADTRESMV